GDRQEFENARLLDAEIRRILEARRNVRNIDVLAFVEGERWPRLLASSSVAWRAALSSSQLKDLRERRVIARLVRGADGRHWGAIAPIELDDAVAGGVAVEFSLAFADEQFAGVRFASLAIAGASALVAVLLIGLVVRRLVDAPIREFLRIIGDVERGARGARLSVTRRDEFGMLATHFNRMLEELERARVAQEEQVRQGTAELAERYGEVTRLNELLFQTQRRLRHSDRLALLGRTMAMVAHEVGTPLHSIAGHLELLAQELPAEVLRGSPERRLAVVRSQLARVTDTIEQLLAATRRPAGPRAPADLVLVVREVLNLVSPAVPARPGPRRGGAGAAPARVGGRAPDPAGAAQRHHQRARCDARGRHAPRPDCGRAAGRARLGAGIDRRHRPRHPARPPEKDLRAVLHDQGAGQGGGARAVHHPAGHPRSRGRHPAGGGRPGGAEGPTGPPRARGG